MRIARRLSVTPFFAVFVASLILITVALMSASSGFWLIALPVALMAALMVRAFWHAGGIVALADAVMTRVLLEAGSMPLGEAASQIAARIAPPAGITSQSSLDCWTGRRRSLLRRRYRQRRARRGMPAKTLHGRRLTRLRAPSRLRRAAPAWVAGDCRRDDAEHWPVAADALADSGAGRSRARRGASAAVRWPLRPGGIHCWRAPRACWSGVVLAGLLIFVVSSLAEIVLTMQWTRRWPPHGLPLVCATCLRTCSESRSVRMAPHSVGDAMGRVAVDAWCVHAVVDTLLFAPGHALITMC